MDDELQTLKVSSLNVVTPETIKEEITNHFEKFASNFLIDKQSFISTVSDKLFRAFKKYSAISTLKSETTYQ
jgi:hypothetical protein